ncbi:hypothetical protein BZG13_05960 [Salinivibrio sp. ML323]|uniref:Pilus assembly protein PilP n=1 Tax=Salinivibrio kushneri TaxID=1908198 RepID=A0AB36K5X8_9GAMM|nr:MULTISPECIES: pilus assembly protein PilP [Salinivibrio]OOE43653.1 hypothetical protein BZG09_09960 [Salinivibrio kushneri]OOE46933.1 hypothetical protein BZG06_05040 [Salinivibrio kushneri]OOE58542.1 hypothetical protein BZG13_05960 [Salinivibrio sp. ML323]OOE65999.1 hypothetical protein BZG14_05380 [Salinivibrio sp. IB282]
MRRYGYIFLALLSGCHHDHTDIDQFMRQAKSHAEVSATRIPPAPTYQPLAFSASGRDPFFLAPDSRQDLAAMGDCWQPTSGEQTSPLTAVPLDQLQMTGSLTKGEQRQALMALPSGLVRKVKRGERLGPHHGRVIQVAPNQVRIKQLLPDGLGCWQPRFVTLSTHPGVSEKGWRE